MNCKNELLSFSIQKLMRTSFLQSDGFSVGTLLEDCSHGKAGEHLVIPYNQLFAGHMMMPGKTGTGKSYLTASLIIQLLLNRHHALVCIDPVGGLHKRVISFLSGLYQTMTLLAMREAHPLRKQAVLAERNAFFEKVIILDFTQEDGVDYGLNLFEVWEGYDIEMTSGDAVRLMEGLFGDMSQMRRMQNILRSFMLLTAFVDNGTFEDMARLIMATKERLRSIVLGIDTHSKKFGKNLDLKFAKTHLLYLTSLSDREYTQIIESTYNALNAMGLSEQKVYDFFVVQKSNLSLKKLIDEGYYLFVNLDGKGDLNSSQVIGSAIVNRLITLCSMRSEQDKDDPNKKVILIGDELHKLVNKTFSETISVCRNWGLTFCGAFQYYGQLEAVGDESLKMGLTANIRNTFHFQLGRDDAEELASSLGRPDGQVVLRRRIEIAHSTGRGYAYSISETISQSIAFAKNYGITESISLSNGESVNVTISDSTTVVEAKGWSVAKGENWSQAKMRGVTFNSSTSKMQGSGQTDAIGRGSSLGGSKGKSTGESIGHSTSESNFVSFNNGETFLPLEVNPTNRSFGRGEGQAKSKGDSHTTSNSQFDSESWSNSLSNIVSKARSQAITKTSGQGRSFSETETKGGSLTHTESINESLSKMQGIARGVAKTHSEQKGYSQTEGETVTTGLSKAQGKTEQWSYQESETTKEVVEYANLSEEAELFSHELQDLPLATCYVKTRSIPGRASKVKTHHLNLDFPLVRNGVDYVKEMRKHSKPDIPLQKASNDAFELLELKLKQFQQEEEQKELAVFVQNDVDTGVY